MRTRSGAKTQRVAEATAHNNSATLLSGLLPELLKTAEHLAADEDALQPRQ